MTIIKSEWVDDRVCKSIINLRLRQKDDFITQSSFGIHGVLVPGPPMVIKIDTQIQMM
jgi:hypothetical protein